MKKLFIFLLAGGFSLMIRAQTNTPATPADKSGERDVDASSHNFYSIGSPIQQAVYYDNVRITNSQGKLTCERLTINFAPKDSMDTRPTNVVAETNVILDYYKSGDVDHITCDKMINDYSVKNGITNDIFKFTGHAKMVNAKGWMTGEPLIWNNVTERFSGVDFETHGTATPSTGTNIGSSPLDILKLK